MPAINSSGASDASGAINEISTKSSIANLRPVSTSDSANGSAHTRIVTTATPNSATTAARRRAVGIVPIVHARARRDAGFPAGARGDAHHVDDEDRDEDRGVDQRERAVQRAA